MDIVEVTQSAPTPDDALRDALSQLALADKVIQAARKHFHWAGGRGHNVACNYPDDTAPRCNCGSNDLRTALAEYDRERAAP